MSFLDLDIYLNWNLIKWRNRNMTYEQNTNTGYKGHYWTEVMSLDDMRATEDDIRRYYEQKRY